jgi:hypothetical protein
LSMKPTTNNNRRHLQLSTIQGEPTITAISTKAIDQFLLNGGCK